MYVESSSFGIDTSLTFPISSSTKALYWSEFFFIEAWSLGFTSCANSSALSKIDKTKATVDSEIDKMYKDSIAKLEKDNKTLSDTLDNTKIERAQEVKPKLQASMKKNSDQYRALVDEEIGKVKDVSIPKEELSTYINNQYIENPQKGMDLIKILSNGGDTPTVGSIYNNIKDLRQTIGSAARGGKRVFTPEEMNTTEAISKLASFLKDEKGVDLSKANQFWSNYADLRNKTVKYIQPFTNKGSESSTFNTFADMIGKSDPKNVNFIKATEDLLGEKLADKKVLNAMSALEDNKKAKLASVMDKELKALASKEKTELEKLKADTTLTESMKTLKEKKLRVDQQV